MSNIELQQAEDAQKIDQGVREEIHRDHSATILFAIQHPAHVHLFQNSIRILSQNGYDVHVFARKKEINTDLLDLLEIDYELLAGEINKSWQMPFVQFKYEWGIIRKTRQLNPDVLVAVGEPAITHAAKLTDATSLVFTDTEHATLQNILAFPFADYIHTPECYQEDIGPKQRRYPGYHELAYLHPDRFEPDPSILDEVGLDRTEQFVVLRLVSWDAMHDVGQNGFEDIVDAVDAIEETGARVLITSEADLPPAIVDRQVSIPPHRIHDLLAFADLYIGESATMTAESAVLGTPAVYISSIRIGYTDELEKKYGLVFTYPEAGQHERGLKKAIEILNQNSSRKWETRRQRMLMDKKDTTDVILTSILESVEQ
jgi:hypothetical protein